MTLQRQSGTLELTLSLFAGIVLLFGAAVWVLIPETKAFLQVREGAEMNLQKTLKLQTEYDALYTQKETAEAEAAALAEQWENRADAAALAAWIGMTWNGAEVAAGADEGAYEVQAAMATPAEFYRFVDRLETAPWVMRVGLPVAMRAGGGKIIVRFSLRAARRTAATLPMQK